MIAWLSGLLRHKSVDRLVVDVGGVGYEVAVSLSTYSRAPETGDPITLHVHTHVREDALNLYGFSTEIEKEVFLLLIDVSGVGPKLALGALSALSVEDLLLAITASDDAKLCSIPGIGKKTAARLCLELKDKIRHLAPLALPQAAPSASPLGTADDAVSALINLGYRRPQAEEAVAKVGRTRPDARVEELIREALGELRRR
jgi:Holliday junction DNA helicase RuvA